MKPTDNFNVDVHVDADFAGLWPHEDKHDPTCVKSRTGYAICIADCPVVWGSKLQGSIALSTTEAEYNALSMVMRLVLPLLELYKTIGSSLGIQSEVITQFRTTVWEDNNGCLILANLEPGRQTPRSKHCAIKQHWFRSHLRPNGIEVKKIDTLSQKADILTKSLGAIKFRKIRKLLCGWQWQGQNGLEARSFERECRWTSMMTVGPGPGGHSVRSCVPHLHPDSL